jgi:hypothetical protein
MELDSQRKTVTLIWWGIGLLILIAYVEGAGSRIFAEWSQSNGITWAIVFGALRALVVIGVIIALFWVGAKVIPQLIQGTPESGTAPATEREQGACFPQSATLPIGLWLAVISLVLIAGLFEVLSPNPTITWLSAESGSGGSGTASAEMRNLLVTIFAAGVGSMITTILGYLKHASERRDFMLSFVPWYFARPLIGILLGVVFYFVLKGGLLVTVGAASAADINVYGLGALAALVGLFSKNAVEKLRDVFGTLFTTEADVRAALLDRLPKDLAEQVAKALEGQK